MTKEMLTPFIEETKAMFIERASWNDDENVECLKNITIQDFYADYIDENGILHDNLDMIEPEFAYGHYTEFISIFNEIRNTLWYSGIIQQVYAENARYDLDDCYDYMTDSVWEMCPHCEEEVELKATMKMQPCPNCGAMIAPCALCCQDYVNCSLCPIGAN